MKFLLTALLTAASLLCSGCSETNENVLHIYNWAESFPRDVLVDFEKETGIKVIYDNFDNNDTLEAKILLGISGYDVVFPSAWPYFSRQARAGLYQKLDPQKLNFLDKLNPTILKFFTSDEPGSGYGIPYMWGILAFAYNVKKISKIPNLPLDSYAAVYEREHLKKLRKCGIAFPDEALDIFPYIMRYLKTESLNQAVARMKEIKPYVRRFDLIQSVQELANGSLCFIHAPLGPAFRAKVDLEKANSPIKIGFSYPKEGIPLWMDIVAIPKNAPHVANAYKFINFIYRPEILARTTNLIYEFNMIDETVPYLLPELRKLRSTVLAHKDRFVKNNIKDRERVRALNKSLEQIIFGTKKKR